MSCLSTNIVVSDGVRHRLPLIAPVVALVQLAVVCQALAKPLPGEVSGTADSVALFSGASTAASPTLRSASAGCPCNGTNGLMKTSTVSAVTLEESGGLMSATNIIATAVGTNADDTASTTEEAGLSKLNLLGGLITADAIIVDATAEATPITLETSDEGTRLTNLVIAGTSIDPAVPDNTSFPVPGIGSVTVKAVTGSRNPQRISIEVHGLLIEVSATNSFGLPVGSRIEIANARAGYSREQPSAFLAGSGVGAELTGDVGHILDGAVGVGKSVGLPSCNGTAGSTLEGATGALSIPGLASAVSEQATAFGGPVGAALVTRTTATLSNITVLGGLVTADSVAAVAQVSRTGNISTPSAAGSGLSGLTVAGVPVPANPPMNLKLALPGFGYVIVNEQTPGPLNGRMEVIGLDVHVTQTNLLGIPVGARLMMGRAVATARRF